MLEPLSSSNILAGGGVSGALIRSIDWTKTPVGAVASWPRSLLTIVETILHSRHPMFLWWGPELIQFYNDAYLPSFGVGKHPAAMGQPGRECWGEIWPIIGPQIENVMAHGTPTWHEDALVPIRRNDRIEEVYWTYGYSPVFDDDRRIGGTLVICTETTQRVIAARRERLFDGVAQEATASNQIARLLDLATASIHDIPLAVAFDAGGELIARSGAWPAHDNQPEDERELAQLAARSAYAAGGFDLLHPIDAGPWPEPVSRGFAVPLRRGGLVVFGLSPRLPFDVSYREFLLRVVDSIGIAQERAEAAAVRAAADQQRTNLYRHFMQAPFPIAVFRGPTHVIELANPPVLAAWGKGADVIGLPLSLAIPELHGQPFLGWLDGVLRTGVAHEGVEQLALLPTGLGGALEEMYCNFVYAPLRGPDGAIEGVLLSAFLVTDQVRARQMLERTLARAESSEAQLHAAQRAANVGIFDWDVVGDRVIWSAELCALIGLAPAAIETSRLACIDTVVEDDRPRVWAACREAERTRSRLLEVELRLRHAAGASRWVRLSTELEYDAAGATTRAFGAIVDIQGLKEAAEQRERALAEAERISRAKDEFVATMSHELRTPLNAILGWATMLRAMPGDAERLARGLAVIERNAEAQARLISDLLDVSRIISGKLRLAVQRVDVITAIHTALDVVRPAADAKDVHLVAALSEDTGALVADPDRLQQIVWNLLSNAVKFTPAGGTVRVTAERVASRVKICVVDTGAGIAREHLPVIFERFRQIDGSITRSHGGLGLGLAIVRHLVEAHGGTVTADSEGLGAGTTFTVEIPVRALHAPDVQHPQRTAEPSQPAAAPAADGRLAGLRVLAVDDEQDSLELLRLVLEMAGATVVGASSAESALTEAARSRFDLVISDIGMPEVDGYGFMRSLRSRDRGGDVPSIALTAYARAEDALRAFRAGYQEHVTKPVDAAALVATVERLVRG